MRRCALAIALLVMLSACTVGGIDDGGRTEPVQTAAPSASTASGSPDRSDLEARRVAAGIADCPSSTAPAVDHGLPDLTLSCLGGGSQVRLSGLRGPMVVNLWGSWCAPCREEAPHLSEVAAQAGDQVQFLGILYHDAAPDAAIAFMAEHRQSWPQVVDETMVSRGPLRVSGVPMSWFVRADGSIAAVHAGPFTSADQLRTEIRDQLGVEIG